MPSVEGTPIEADLIDAACDSQFAPPISWAQQERSLIDELLAKVLAPRAE